MENRDFTGEWLTQLCNPVAVQLSGFNSLTVSGFYSSFEVACIRNESQTQRLKSD